jgi:hypothetical protein
MRTLGAGRSPAIWRAGRNTPRRPPISAVKPFIDRPVTLYGRGAGALRQGRAFGAIYGNEKLIVQSPWKRTSWLHGIPSVGAEPISSLAVTTQSPVGSSTPTPV